MRRTLEFTLRILSLGIVIWAGWIAYQTWYPFARWQAQYDLPLWTALWFRFHPFLILFLATIPAHLADFIGGRKPVNYIWVPGMKW
jgi:hypothetical protein